MPAALLILYLLTLYEEIPAINQAGPPRVHVHPDVPSMLQMRFLADRAVNPPFAYFRPGHDRRNIYLKVLAGYQNCN